MPVSRSDSPVSDPQRPCGHPQPRQPGRNFLADQLREPILVRVEPVAQEADGLQPHLGVAQNEVLEVLPPERSQDG